MTIEHLSLTAAVARNYVFAVPTWLVILGTMGFVIALAVFVRSQTR